MQKVHSMLNLFIFLTTIAFFIYLFTFIDNTSISRSQIARPEFKYFISSSDQKGSDYNLWLIFTKVVEQTPLYHNFQRLIENLLAVTSVPIDLHVITDDASKQIAIEIFQQMKSNVNASKITYQFYNVSDFASSIKDIVEAMTPHFSSRPGTYYSDALFYISLGLYRLAPMNQKLAVMIDCDVHFKQDVALLFDQFKYFREGELFALAPELSIVYRHILYSYKQKHNTTFGEYLHAKPINQTFEAPQHPKGFPGYNSGVVLFNLTAIRNSSTYRQVIKKESVDAMVGKYRFRGHLGDQDFYTLLGYEHPEMIRMLSCAFNRQLCTWWRDKGEKGVFDKYFQCDDDIVVLHGNCNTRMD